MNKQARCVVEVQAGGTWVLSGTLNLDSLGACCAEIEEKVLRIQAKSIKVNFVDVNCGDVSMIVVVVQLLRLAYQHQFELKLLGISSNLLQMLKLYGLTNIDDVLHSS